ncbi:Uncharacterized membrane protein [Alkalithermobacter thermoalcaliphilus JW-YL-7 = DSM 7308]|uniref:Uncharacterized membrane protein n=1 Tax=Alkalithermobacter thermoalcaliphilus JW-YL-7 = DSM 7308 TaxID=1121328 RepID=A0A150FPC7_CLOPD|nr:hypothetical protein JWYL7_0566 [[Clostridium] paradoxum JW-YL-7 = DSM 7308]SHK49728.1 Uncharacterized membrane protein [[Clostridium] paradoxum JW-YL-7 = DSM 7308]
MNKEKLKQYALWASVFAFIPLLLEAFGVDVLPQNYAEITKAFLGILVLAGIIYQPENEEDKEEEKGQD